MLHFTKLILDLEESVSSEHRQMAIENYLLSAPQSDHLWAIWLIRGHHPKRIVSLDTLRIWAEELMHLPGWLIQESQEQVGDIAEAIGILLPRAKKRHTRSLSESLAILQDLRTLDQDTLAQSVIDLWKESTAEERFVWNKLLAGSFRLKIKDSIIAKAIAEFSGSDYPIIIANLQSNWSPHTDDFSCLVDDKLPSTRDALPYKLEDVTTVETMPIERNISEWYIQRKYRGLQCQIVVRNDAIHIWHDGQQLITAKFPEFENWPILLQGNFVFLADLVAFKDGRYYPDVDLYSRLTKKRITAKICKSTPVEAIVYDMIEKDGVDITTSKYSLRYSQLNQLLKKIELPNISFAKAIKIRSGKKLKAHHDECRTNINKGLLLTHGSFQNSISTPGLSLFLKTKAIEITAVLLYIKSSQGGRGGSIEELTFAVQDDQGFIPVVRITPSLTSAEIADLQQFIYANTFEKFGPVRSVDPTRKCIIRFDDIQLNRRRKCGFILIRPEFVDWLEEDNQSKITHLNEMKRMIPGLEVV